VCACTLKVPCRYYVSPVKKIALLHVLQQRRCFGCVRLSLKRDCLLSPMSVYDGGHLCLCVNPKKPTRVAAPSPRASLGRRTVCGRMDGVGRRFRSATKLRLECYGGVFSYYCYCCSAALKKTLTRNGYITYNAHKASTTSLRVTARCISCLSPASTPAPTAAKLPAREHSPTRSTARHACSRCAA